MKNFEKEFYSHLGLLSVEYAKMEYNLSKILGKLIRTDEETINVTLIEDNTLHRNISMLKKINRIRDFKASDIETIIELIGRVKNDRNKFIHGIWGNPFEDNGEIKIICEERKIKYTETKDKNGIVFRRNWQYNDHFMFSLTYLKEQIDTIKHIINLQENLIDELEEVDFF